MTEMKSVKSYTNGNIQISSEKMAEVRKIPGIAFADPEEVKLLIWALQVAKIEMTLEAISGTKISKASNLIKTLKKVLILFEK